MDFLIFSSVASQVIKNSSGANLAVDIWSLGCTVLEMATTKPPWSQYEGVIILDVKMNVLFYYLFLLRGPLFEFVIIHCNRFKHSLVYLSPV